MKLVKPKPDISLANKTGHFNLLTTGPASDVLIIEFDHDLLSFFLNSFAL